MALTPYTPGEQPKDQKYIKLNTNESPYTPPKAVVEAVKNAAKTTQLYCDPTCSLLVEKASEIFGVDKDMILPTNAVCRWNISCGKVLTMTYVMPMLLPDCFVAQIQE